jgi:hypothetical protein
LSTKIYTGVYMPKLSVEAALTRLGELSSAVQAHVDAYAAALLAKRVVRSIDDYCVSRFMAKASFPDETMSETDSPYIACRRALLAEQATCRGGYQRNPGVDCDVELFLMIDPKTRRLQGLFQEEGAGARARLLEACPDMLDYAYWNNSDRPDEISAQAWEARKRRWDRAYENPVRMSMRWLPQMCSSNELIPYFPSFEERLQRVSKKHVEESAFQDRYHPPKEAGSFSGVSRVLRQISDEMREPGSDLFKKLREQEALLAPVLLRELSPHLWTAFGELP